MPWASFLQKCKNNYFVSKFSKTRLEPYEIDIPNSDWNCLDWGPTVWGVYNLGLPIFAQDMPLTGLGSYSLGAYSLGAYSFSGYRFRARHGNHWTGGLQSGGLQYRATDFGPGSALTCALEEL